MQLRYSNRLYSQIPLELRIDSNILSIIPKALRHTQQALNNSLFSLFQFYRQQENRRTQTPRLHRLPTPKGQPAPYPENENQRLLALQRYEVLDTLPEQAFDDLTVLAASI
jgi:hypothetical protein